MHKGDAFLNSMSLNLKHYQSKQKDSLDVFMLTIVLLLMALGMTMVASTSMPISLDRYGYVHYFTSRHAINLVLAMVVLTCTLQCPPNRIQKMVPWIVLVTLLLGVWVLLFGAKINGSRRWINLVVFNVQVSEIMKVAFILYVADFFKRKMPWEDGLLGFMPLGLIYGMMAVLLLLEPDFGSTVVLGFIMFTMMLMSPIKFRYLLVLLILAAIGIAVLIWIEPYRMERLLSYVDPWQDRFGSGYQVVQSQMAIARGGWFGVGLGHSMQKLFYLPESHTDFIFAVLVEELGTIIALTTIIMYAALILRLMWWANVMQRKQRLFTSYVMLGWSQWLFIQIIINIGATIGVMPTKGLTLPFISYGGSSIIAHAFMLGLVLSLLRNQKEEV